MTCRYRFLLYLAAASVAFPARSPAPVVFSPNGKVKYHAPGEEEISGKAEELFAIGQAAERDGNRKRAIKAYTTLVKKYPHSTLASGALFRAAKLTEDGGDLVKAARLYRALMEFYPNTQHFTEAIEAQFRIGELYVNGKKLKLFGVPVGASMDTAVEIFAAIVRSAPYGRYTARAQFDIGRAREKQGAADLAITAYQAVVEKFPNDPLAVDAQYQIGYIWLKETRSGNYDPKAAAQAQTAFQDFLFRFPKSEKVPQAQEDLRELQQHQINSSLDVAKYYDRRKNYRAAVIYYNEVIRQQPDSPQSTAAKNRIAQLRKKVGDAALLSAADYADQQAKKHPKKPLVQAPPAAAPGVTPTVEGEPAKPAMRAGAADIAPLPPSSDSLPPPAGADAMAPPSLSPTPVPSATP